MLDFYLIKDNQSKPNSPEQADLIYLSGVDETSFNKLIEKGIIDARFDYYSDFRWSTKMIQQMHSKIMESNLIGNEIDVLKKILDRAILCNEGIIAYCD